MLLISGQFVVVELEREFAMRQIALKYDGECRRCGASLEVGQAAMYEKSMGIFCPGHEPTETEDIRHFRTLKAEAKAEKYDAWAAKREQRASAQLNSYPEIRHDTAFCTQPGRIPFRERMNKADARAFESLEVANGMRSKAQSLRHVRVKGDADTARQARREAVLSWLKVGMEVDTGIYHRGIVRKINRKTAKIGNCGASGTYTTNVDLSFLRPAGGA